MLRLKRNGLYIDSIEKCYDIEASELDSSYSVIDNIESYVDSYQSHKELQSLVSEIEDGLAALKNYNQEDGEDE